MGFLDRLFGSNTDDNSRPPQAPQRSSATGRSEDGRSEDEIAVERYHYLLRTAPPETIEKVHLEAFSKLTPEQRDLLYTQLTRNAPDGEAPRGSDPASLATAATRSELRQPGTMERSMSAPGMGFGGMVGSTLLGTVAGYVIGSALVSAFLPNDTGGDASGDGGDAGADSGTDASADASADGGDYGSDAGGGDFGGGDFGGGDFGGGDF